ncbi:MAG: ABC transporter ATP-binding protein, partial [Saprospiraceae bacterium]
GGERARLALACMILSQTNLLIMDEPTHHLDIQAKQRLKDALMEYPGALIIISHDRDFLTGLTSRTIEFGGGQIKEYLGDIDEMLVKKGIENLDALTIARAQAVEDKSKVKLEAKEAKQEIKETRSKKTELISPQEKKNMQRRFSQIEKDIAGCESVIKENEVKLADPDFYKSNDFFNYVSKYESKKKELEKLMVEWEKLADEMSNA